MGFMQRDLKIFRGTLPSKRSGRNGNCLSAKGASFAIAAKRDAAGSKKIYEHQ
jgi:hypothetical protein